MAHILVLYGTTDGHTAKIARAIGQTLQDAGCLVDEMDSRRALRTVRATRYAAVIVAASVHAGGYQRAVTRWVRANQAALAARPTMFVSVCLGVLEPREAARRELGRIMSRFLKATAWNPQVTTMVAGAIPYLRYNWLKKRIMRHIAAKAGGGTDVSKDYEYTDWTALRETVLDFAHTNALVPDFVFQGRPEI